MMKSILYIALLSIFFTTSALADNNFDFNGEASILGKYSPDNYINTQFAGRYIPQLLYSLGLDDNITFDLDASFNINGSVSAHPFEKSTSKANIDPYRLWTRLYGNQFEIRLGLQKIDFGTATLLRPMQWFNQMDPRDPLAITNGVYGALGRYYFLDNSNVWIWALYGNDEKRGLDAIESNRKQPEFGGRVQIPTPKGEIALSYHHRDADASLLFDNKTFSKIPEDRIGLDGKWDVEIGFWFEAAYIHKSKNIGFLSNQTLFNIGADYTFDIGNGLNVVIEHLILSYDENSFKFKQNDNISASSMSYPLGLDDNLSSIVNYSWDSKDFSFHLNYQHQYQKILAFLMVYYNSESQNILEGNLMANKFTGPGIQFMLVYNH